jgi:hypothetical protein
MYICVYVYMYTHIYIHYIHYITLHYNTLHYITLRIYIYTHTYALYIGSPHGVDRYGSVKNRLTKISDMSQNHRFYFRMIQYVYIPPSSEFPVSTLATGYFPSNAAASFLFRRRKVRWRSLWPRKMSSSSGWRFHHVRLVIGYWAYILNTNIYIYIYI